MGKYPHFKYPPAKMAEILFAEATKLNKEIEENDLKLKKYHLMRYKFRRNLDIEIQELLIVMAVMSEEERLPILLDGIISRQILRTVLKCNTFPKATYFYDQRRHLEIAELESTDLVQAAKKILKSLPRKKILKRFKKRIESACHSPKENRSLNEA